MGIFSRLKRKAEPSKGSSSQHLPPSSSQPSRQAASRPGATTGGPRTTTVASTTTTSYQKPVQSQVDEFTQEIKNRRDHIKLLEKNRDFKQKQIDNEVKKALQLKQKGDTKGALACMKRKKRYEKAMEVISNQMETIERGIDALEAQARNAEVLKALEGTNSVMKKQQVDVEKADTVLEDMQETIDKVEEVNMAFNQTQIGEQYDEDELLAELESEGVQQKVQSVPDTILPNVPTAVPKVGTETEKAAPQETEEERELRELERAMAAGS